MNAFKRLMGVLLVGGAGFGLFVACGGGGDDCTLDSDCAAGEACEGQVCVATCMTNDDCLEGEVCQEGVNTSEMVCQLDSDASNMTNNTSNMTNNGSNNTTPNNLPTVYYDVQILSTTSSDEACVDANDNDPGPDIFGVGIEDSTGSPLGWGIVEWSNVTLDGNDHSDDTVLDGQGPNLAADVCPDSFDGNVVSLGCDANSWLVVSFVDSDDNPIPLDATADQVIRVYEWGGQCTTGSIDDTYNVNICTERVASAGGDVSSCTLQVIVDGAGESDGPVGF